MTKQLMTAKQLPISILVAEDEEDHFQEISSFIKAAARNRKIDYEIEMAENGFQACDKYDERFNSGKPFEIVFVDLVKFPPKGGQWVVEHVIKREGGRPRSKLVLMSAQDPFYEQAGKAAGLGVISDYIKKPLKEDEPRFRIGKVLDEVLFYREFEDLKTTVRVLQQEVDSKHIIKGTLASGEFFEDLAKIAKSDSVILLQGESGTGKEIIARAIHRISNRSPFLPVNCSTIPEHLFESHLFGHEKGAFTGADRLQVGYFEEADGGTLFLDEIAELPLSTQAKLLRVLEEKEIFRLGNNKPIPIDVRILAATHKDLSLLVEEHAFREDLFYRINVLAKQVPPLRDRTSDISELAVFFLARFRQKIPNACVREISPEAMAWLMQYHWKGNVRELRNVIENLVVRCNEPIVQIKHLHDYIKGPSFSGSTRTSGWEFSGKGIYRGISVKRELAKLELLFIRWFQEQGWAPEAIATALSLSKKDGMWQRLRDRVIPNLPALATETPELTDYFLNQFKNSYPKLWERCQLILRGKDHEWNI